MNLADLLDDIFWVTLVILVIFRRRIAAFIRDFQSRRYRFNLATQKEKTRQERARAEALAEQNRQTELNVRAAELEIERFDLRFPAAPAAPALPSAIDSSASSIPDENQ